MMAGRNGVGSMTGARPPRPSSTWRLGGRSGATAIRELCAGVEKNSEETWRFYRLPRQHPNHMKSTKRLERFMEEIQRRPLVVRIFPNAAAGLRLVRTLAVAMDENWMEARPYLNLEPRAEQKREALRKWGDA